VSEEMKLKFKEDDSRCGAILAVVLIVTLAVTTLGSGMIALNGASAVEVSKAISAAEAFWTAEAGLALVKAVASNNSIPFDQMSSFNSGILSFNGSRFVATIDGRTATVTFPAPPGWDNATQRVKFYDMTSSGTSAAGVVREVTMQSRIETFASYMHASQWEQTAWGGNIYFGPGDVINGELYVNDQLNIWGIPKFEVHAFSAADTVNYQSSRFRTGVDSDVFTKGLTLGAEPLDFDDPDEHLDALQLAADAGGIAFDGTYRLTFVDNATLVSERNLGADTWAPAVTNDLSTKNGAIYVSGDARVSGEVNGNITLGVRSEIFIEGDLTYASAVSKDHSDWEPSDFNAIDDVLGLIAKDGVTVDRDDSMKNFYGGMPPINIHGSILVTEGGFGCARRYETIGNPSINLYGGITQFRRGIVGQLSSPPNGFSKNYYYDEGLQLAPPRWFPYSEYTFSQWRQSR